MTLNEQKFYIPKKRLTKSWFDNNGFYLNKVMSDEDEEVYTKRFAVWRYGNAGVIEGEIMINKSTGDLNIGCYDYGTRYPYAGWYCRKYGKNDVVDVIDGKITRELEKIGAKTHDE